MNKMPIIFIFFFFIFLFGCTQQQNAEVEKTFSKKEFVEQQLNLASVDGQIVEQGEEIICIYETKNKDFNYEGELLADWGTIFGILSYSYPDAKYYTIDMQLNGQRIYQLSIDSKSVKDYKEGKITLTQLKEKFIIKK